METIACKAPHVDAGLDECGGHLHHELVKVRMEAVQTAVNCHRHLRLTDAIDQNRNTYTRN